MKFLRACLCVAAYLCLAATMFAAFGFSSQDGKKSDGISKKVTSVVTGKSIEEINRLELKKGKNEVTVNGIIRKCAHFSLYFMMGVFAYLSVALSFNRKAHVIVGAALAICFLYAAGDEIHQYFSNGRTAAFGDVLLDFSGASLGVFSVFGIRKKFFGNICPEDVIYGKNS